MQSLTYTCLVRVKPFLGALGSLSCASPTALLLCPSRPGRGWGRAGRAGQHPSRRSAALVGWACGRTPEPLQLTFLSMESGPQGVTESCIWTPLLGCPSQRLTAQAGGQQQVRTRQPQESPGPRSPSGPGSPADSGWDRPGVTVEGQGQVVNVSHKEG